MKKKAFKCAFCEKEVPSDAEVYGMGVKLKEGMNYPSGVGRMTQVDLPIQDKTFQCMVTADGSRAKSDGWDLVFVVCSEECGGALKEYLKKEKGLFEEIM